MEGEDEHATKEKDEMRKKEEIKKERMNKRKGRIKEKRRGSTSGKGVLKKEEEEE